jgi:hypothetical protein
VARRQGYFLPWTGLPRQANRRPPHPDMGPTWALLGPYLGMAYCDSQPTPMAAPISARRRDAGWTRPLPGRSCKRSMPCGISIGGTAGTARGGYLTGAGACSTICWTWPCRPAWRSRRTPRLGNTPAAASVPVSRTWAELRQNGYLARLRRLDGDGCNGRPMSPASGRHDRVSTRWAGDVCASHGRCRMRRGRQSARGAPARSERG